MDAIRESPWDLPDAARPRLLRCTLAPPEKGTLAGKPPVSPGGVDKVADLVTSTPVARKTPEVGVQPRTNGLAAVSGGEVVPRSEDLPAAEDPTSNRPAPDHSAPVDGTQETLMPRESASDDIAMADPASTDGAVTTLANTQGDAENTQETTQIETQPGQGDSLDLPTDRPITDRITQVPVLEPRHRPATYRVAAPPAPTATPRKAPNFHVRPDLIPVTRFHAKDLEEHWYKLAAFVLDGTGSLEERMKWFYPAHVEVDSTLFEKVQQYIEKHPTTFPSGPISTLTDEETSKYYVKTTNPDVEPIMDPAGLKDKSHPFMFVPAAELDNEVFDRLWARGEPIVVDKVGERFKQAWTPDTFIERFGEEGCCMSSALLEMKLTKQLLSTAKLKRS